MKYVMNGPNKETNGINNRVNTTNGLNNTKELNKTNEQNNKTNEQNNETNEQNIESNEEINETNEEINETNEQINETILYEMIYLLNPVNVNDKTIYTFIDKIPEEPIKKESIETYDTRVLEIYEKLKSEYLIKPSRETIDYSHHGYKNPIEFYTICGRIMDSILNKYHSENESNEILPLETLSTTNIPTESSPETPITPSAIGISPSGTQSSTPEVTQVARPEVTQVATQQPPAAPDPPATTASAAPATTASAIEKSTQQEKTRGESSSATPQEEIDEIKDDFSKMIKKNFVLRQFKTRILNTIEKVLKEYSKKELITEIKKIVGEISIPDELQKYLETLTTETTSEPAAPEQEQEGAADPAKTAANTLAPSAPDPAASEGGQEGAADPAKTAANTLAPAAPDPAASQGEQVANSVEEPATSLVTPVKAVAIPETLAPEAPEQASDPEVPEGN